MSRNKNKQNTLAKERKKRSGERGKKTESKIVRYGCYQEII